ncbi:MAG TPA: hypothetical protein VGM66_04645 [Candidatus Udaeobacter sp.]
MKNAVLTLIGCCAAASVLAQDYLIPEDDVFAGPDQYYVKMRQVFAEPLHHDILLQVLYLPSFQLEQLVGIRKNDSGFEAFASKPSTQIWTTFNIWQAESGQMKYEDEHGKEIPPDKNPDVQDMKKHAPSDFRLIRVHTDARAIAAHLAQRIERVWQQMLVEARKPEDRRIPLDGENYHFSLPSSKHKRLHATVRSPDDGKTLALTQLALGLADYAAGRIDEVRLSQLVRRVEAMNWPNQTMQPTARRRTASLLVTNTLSFQFSLALTSGG